jgi:hypothetical protein
VVPPKRPGFLGADPGQQAQRDVGVDPVARRRLEHRGGLVGGERFRWPPLHAGRWGHERGDVAADEVVRLGVPDRPLQRVVGENQRANAEDGAQVSPRLPTSKPATRPLAA